MNTTELLRTAELKNINVYENKFQWKMGLFVFAIIIILASLFYTNFIATKLAEEERKKIELWANAIQEMNRLPVNSDNLDISFWSNIIKNNNTIPVILTDEKGIITGLKNLSDTKAEQDSTYLDRILLNMKESYPPIEVDLQKYYAESEREHHQGSEDIPKKQLVYYSDSSILTQLKLYPYIQFLFIAVFLGASYLAFNSARRAEQNKVWLGMAKETAHQLGTPLSSLVAWIELLKEMPDSQTQMIGGEIEKDIGRLKLIAERFSKIGSEPKLETRNLAESVDKTVSYIRRRASGRIKVIFEDQRPPVMTKINVILFDWVIENLLKNALDAMDGKGEINVSLKDEGDRIVITVSDTGKGIPKSKFRTVFEPGYSTKKRGWGLGLSLSKRIVENYHAGKIFVSSSIIDKGTTFKIVLPRES